MENIDKRIKMPDIDQEWKRFEREVIGQQEPDIAPRHWWSRAAVIAVIVSLTLVAGATGYLLVSHADLQPEAVSEPQEQPTAPFATEEPVQVTEYLDQTADEWTFDNVAMSEIARCLHEQYGVEVTFGNEAARHIRLYVSFGRDQSLSEVIALLNNLQKVQLRLEDNHLIIE